MSIFDYLQNDFDSIDAEEFLKKSSAYKNMQSDDIDGIPDNELLFAITAWVEAKFNDDWSDMGYVINEINTPPQNVYCSDYMLKEFHSGGFNQVFFNTSADFVGISALCFRAIGMENCAAAIENITEEYKKRACETQKSDTSNSLDFFLDMCENNPYSDLDAKFIAVFNADLYNKKIIEYIRNKKQYFGG